MIDIVCFKWQKNNNDYLLSHRVKYTARHVNILYESIKKNTTVPIRFSCITDDPNGIHPDIRIIPLWDKCRELGGCFNRLYLFSKDMSDIIGKRFLAIDLDCVIVDNIDNILEKKEDFCINKFVPQKKKQKKMSQVYNGGLILMDAGAREDVWKKFDTSMSLSDINIIIKKNNLLGSDQAWINYMLGPDESKFKESDGIYSYVPIVKKQGLPTDAKIILFSGKADPSSVEKNWINQYWK